MAPERHVSLDILELPLLASRWPGAFARVDEATRRITMFTSSPGEHTDDH